MDVRALPYAELLNSYTPGVTQALQGSVAFFKVKAALTKQSYSQQELTVPWPAWVWSNQTSSQVWSAGVNESVS